MEWNDTRAKVLAACGACLELHGYAFIQSRSAFEKASSTERRGVYVLLVATKHRNYRLQVWCGVRNNVIEERFHKTSGVDKKYRANYTTINLGCGEYWSLNTEKEVAAAIANAEQFIAKSAIPFLEREYSLPDFSRLLNSNPGGKCEFHGNAANRCHYGLIAARLANDPGFEEFKRVYSEHLRPTNKGFYFPRFEKLIADLES